ncbi:MAG: homocysteine S-methyltransferase family protein, partial [Myxococcota bacterium]
MGTELRSRGVEVPSHVTSIWSAKALLDAPEIVVEVHRDYIRAGAEVITTNSYAVTPPLLTRAGLQDRLEELTVLATELAERARDACGKPVRIAGSVPPLDTSYRPDLVGDDPTLEESYRRIVSALEPNVDLLLCETMSSIREAAAAVRAARETSLEVWVSWTLQGNRTDRLPSGETLTAAYDAIASLGVDAALVNCCGANLV